jgi:hypothetical protein
MRWLVVILLTACNQSSSGPADLSVQDLASAPDLAGDLAAPLDLAPAPVCPDVSTSCVCPLPDSQHVCLTGKLFDYVTDAPLSAAGAIRVAAYDPLAFLSDPTTTPLEACPASPTGCYVINQVSPPTTGLVAIAATDAPGASSPQYALAVVGGTVAAGAVVTADVYLLPRSVVAQWTTTAGVDYTTNGAVVYQFADAIPPARGVVLGSANYITGVQVTDGTNPLAGVRYLAARDTVGASTLTSTQTVGVAISAPITLGNVTGSGGTCNGQACKWTIAQTGGAKGVVFIQNFYSCNVNPQSPGCM